MTDVNKFLDRRMWLPCLLIGIGEAMQIIHYIGRWT